MKTLDRKVKSETFSSKMSVERGYEPQSSVLSVGIGMPGKTISKCLSLKVPPDASKQQSLQTKCEEGKSRWESHGRISLFGKC